MAVMNPAASERNFAPSATAASGPASSTAGVGFDGQTRAPVTPALTAMLSGLVTLCAPAVTRTVKLDVPGPVGVPEITPELPLSVSPAGNAPLAMDHA